MQLVKTTFQDRAQEVNTYYTFINAFIQGSTNDDLNKILKSNLILMLYNLVESSVSNSIEEIHNNIHANNVSFDLLKIEIRKVVISLVKKHLGADDFVTSINDIAIDIVKKSFQKQKMFSGNIDSRKIADLGGKYGFNCTTNYSQTKNGNCLLDIKGRRNDLAHGTFSFTEVGKEYSLQDLERMKDETINYLTEIINNIDLYLTNQDYKELVIPTP